VKGRTFLIVLSVFVLALAGLAVLWPQNDGVVIYVATDRNHSEPILREFEELTGITVQAEYDAEANKTVGLVQRLLTEHREGHTRADVFWNNEIMHTLRLAKAGVLAPYVSPNASEIPDNFKDKDGLWTGFAARARILIVNTEAIPDAAERPQSMRDLVDPKWKGKAAIARPLTGTTLTHGTTLYHVLGEGPARTYLNALHGNDVMFPSGNGPLAKTVALGQRWFGVTDTDDFRKQQVEGRPVTAIYPDQGPGEPGTLLIPNTVARIKNGPHEEWAQKLIDFILSKEVEAKLAASDSAQIPLRADVKRPEHVVGPPTFRAMSVDWPVVADSLDARLKELEALWLK
jgi:iron(III) transport system substrate-binding protein